MNVLVFKLLNIVVISEGNINMVYSNNYNTNINRNAHKISEKVEIEFPQKMKNLMNMATRNHLSKGKK